MFNPDIDEDLYCLHITRRSNQHTIKRLPVKELHHYYATPSTIDDSAYLVNGYLTLPSQFRSSIDGHIKFGTPLELLQDFQVIGIHVRGFDKCVFDTRYNSEFVLFHRTWDIDDIKILKTTLPRQATLKKIIEFVQNGGLI